MKCEVKLIVSGKIFTEEVQANDYAHARQIALARNPGATIVGVNVARSDSSSIPMPSMGRMPLGVSTQGRQSRSTYTPGPYRSSGSLEPVDLRGESPLGKYLMSAAFKWSGWLLASFGTFLYRTIDRRMRSPVGRDIQNLQLNQREDTARVSYNSDMTPEAWRIIGFAMLILFVVLGVSIVIGLAM